MNSESSSSMPARLDLSDVVGQMETELHCLLGPNIHFTTGSLRAPGSAIVSARQQDLVDLLRHLALDAHDAMPEGGTVTIRTGRLHAETECSAIVLHEVRDAAASGSEAAGGRVRKGRSLGLNASYDIIERAGGDFHVSCRGRETVLTICFPVAE
jgi:hypothetical protein